MMEKGISGIELLLESFDEKLVSGVKENVTRYILKFHSADEEYNKHIELKKIHIFRVLREVTDLVTALNLHDNIKYGAQILALLHDIGRFEQYDMFRTFSDAASVNHSKIAVRVIEEQHFLSGLSSSEMDIVYQCIMHHNIPKILPGLPPAVDLLTRILRDADKLDIWRIALENDVWHKIEKYKKDSNYKVPSPILDCFLEQRIVPVELAPTLADSYLLRISWVFDINFTETFRKIDDRNIVSRFLSKFYETDELMKIDQIVNDFIRLHLNEQESSFQ